MTGTREDAAELIVRMIMDSLGPIRQQKQALLQAYCQVELPKYPTMISANLMSETGRFVVAGGRVKVAQQQAVWHARKTLEKLAADPAYSEKLSTALKSAASMSRSQSPYQKLIYVLHSNTGIFLDDVSS